MNGRKLPDGGILYDESDDIEDDIEVEGDRYAPAGLAMAGREAPERSTNA